MVESQFHLQVQDATTWWGLPAGWEALRAEWYCSETLEWLPALPLPCPLLSGKPSAIFSEEFEIAWVTFSLDGVRCKIMNMHEWRRNNYSSEMGQRKMEKVRSTWIGSLMSTSKDWSIFDPFFLVVSSHTRADHCSPDRADPPQTSPPSPLRHCPMNSSRLGSLELSLSLQLGLCLAPSLGCSLTPSPGSKLSDHRAHLICFLPLTCLCPLLPHVQCFESHCLINCVSLFHPQAGE